MRDRWEMSEEDRALRAHQRAKAEADARALWALRRIVSRALASGQLEKLEDARPYLDGGSNDESQD